MKTNKKRKGFTLVELIAVIAILGVLAAILVPNITKMTEKSKIGKIQADAKIVLNVVQTAKAQATDDTKITCYTDAIDKDKGGDKDLELTKAPNTELAKATVTELNNIISGGAGFATWTDLSKYYTK